MAPPKARRELCSAKLLDTMILQGTLDMLILRPLRWEHQHGYGISRAIQAGSANVLTVETGSLCPALHRLEKQGWIAAEWKLTGNKQRAKYYRLTAAGRKHLVSEESRWEQIVKAVSGAMKPIMGEH